MTWDSDTLEEGLYETRLVLPNVRLTKPGVWKPKVLVVTGGGGVAVGGSPEAVSAGKIWSSVGVDSVAWESVSWIAYSDMF